MDIEKLVVSLIFFGFLPAEKFEAAMFKDQKFENFINFLSMSNMPQQEAVQKYFMDHPYFINLLYTRHEIAQNILSFFTIEKILKNFYRKAATTLFEKKLQQHDTSEKHPFVSKEIETAFVKVKKILDKLESGEQEEEKIPLSERYTNFLLENVSRRQGNTVGISTSFLALDSFIRGFKSAEYVILAGRPSMGKTSLALDFAASAMKQNKRVLILSLEMPAEHLAARILPKFNENLTLAATLYGDDFEIFEKEIEAAKQILDMVTLEIEDFSGSGYSMDAIEARIELYRQQNGFYPDFVVLDYIQKILTGSKGDENEKISAISSKISALAKKTKAAWIVLSQLNRDLERRTDKRPTNADLRGSGALEQDADIILFPYRPLVYKERELEEAIERKSDKAPGALQDALNAIRSLAMEPAEIIVSKQRNGPIGKVKVFFDRKRASFVEQI